jgi:hypothetical protein
MELMIVIAVISVLLGLLMPGLTRVRQTTYRVLSASNQRTLGQGLEMWSGHRRGRLPESRVLVNAEEGEQPDLGELMRTYAPLTEDELLAGLGGAYTTLRKPGQRGRRKVSGWYTAKSGWDGLGHLFAQGLVPDSSVFYSPAHWGVHPHERYEEDWVSPMSGPDSQPSTLIYGNYHYLGHLGEDGRAIRADRDPMQIVVTDGMRRRSDLSHRTGMNVLRADGSVQWKSKPTLLNTLPTEDSGGFSIVSHNSVIRGIFADPWKPAASDGDGNP